MKITIEVDCTPEEARSFLGLPDVSAANSVYVDTVTKAMKGVSNPAQMAEYAQALAPMGQEGDTFSFTFTEPGEYPYFCEPHLTMNASVIVEADG